MHSSLIAWIMRAIPFGTIIMYGALGETVTEKSGNLNLGVPGIMYLGGFAGFASAWAYENTAANPNGFVSILIAIGFMAAVVIFQPELRRTLERMGQSTMWANLMLGNRRSDPCIGQ